MAEPRCRAEALAPFAGIRCTLADGHRGGHEATGRTGVTIRWPSGPTEDEEYADATPGGMPSAVTRGHEAPGILGERPDLETWREAPSTTDAERVLIDYALSLESQLPKLREERDNALNAAASYKGVIEAGEVPH